MNDNRQAGARRKGTGSERWAAATGRVEELTAQQIRAIGLLMTGCAVGEVAERVGVSRVTMHNWTRRNEAFIKAMETWRRDMRRNARTRMIAMSNLGLRAISTALEGGNAQVALRMFNGLGVLGAHVADAPYVECYTSLEAQSTAASLDVGLRPDRYAGRKASRHRLSGAMTTLVGVEILLGQLRTVPPMEVTPAEECDPLLSAEKRRLWAE